MEKMSYNTFKEAPPFETPVMCCVKLLSGFKTYHVLTYYDHKTPEYDNRVFDSSGKLSGEVISWRFLTEKEKKIYGY